MIRHIHALLNNTVNAGSMLDGVVGGVIKVHAHARLVFPFFLRLGRILPDPFGFYSVVGNEWRS